MVPVAAIPASPATSTAGTAGQGTDRPQLQQLANEFESMLLLQVMRQVRQTITSLGDEESAGIGGDMTAMTDTIDAELASYLSRAGGFGLARALSHSLGSTPSAAQPPDSATAVGPAADSPASDSAPGGPVQHQQPGADVIRPEFSSPVATPGLGADAPATPRVTSPFGWRCDPIQHVKRFHGGVDLKAAYGQEVPVAAEGRVVSAGPQGDYGLSVVVDHGNGFQTRYAHLSAIDVAPGELVADGGFVGRAGQSGRATGPHLHLEVLRNGERVDPRQWLQSDEFKKVVARAD